MEPLNNGSQSHFASVILVVLGVIVAALIGGFLYVYDRVKVRENTAGYSAIQTPFAVLARDNQYFAQANAAARAGDYEQAIQLYEQALAQAEDSAQASQIQFTIALLEDRHGSALRAIDLYKQIVMDPANDAHPLMRANAIANMVELYYRNGDSAVTEQIFKDPPYSTFFVSNDTSLSYRRLAEYAVSFYPLALPELRIASWYAYRLTDGGMAPSGEDTGTYPSIIQNAIALANQDIDRMRTGTDDAQLIPNILTRKSALYLNMFNAGLATAQETEEVCRAALTIYPSIGAPDGIDGFARYYYAVFISEQGPSRVNDLRAVVAPFYENPGYKGSLAFSFFASEKNNGLGQKTRLVKIANEDPKFKTLLISLGWNGKDF
jgi:tetratricopeptide (TPR) repeat protein